MHGCCSCNERSLISRRVQIEQPVRVIDRDASLLHCASIECHEIAHDMECDTTHWPKRGKELMNIINDQPLNGCLSAASKVYRHLRSLPKPTVHHSP
jgi:hypothetical protein